MFTDVKEMYRVAPGMVVTVAVLLTLALLLGLSTLLFV